MLRHTRRRRHDEGSVLLLTLVVVAVLAVVVVALAKHATTNLAFGNDTADATRRMTAADGALKAAIDVVAAGGAPCLYSNAASAIDIPDLGAATNGLTPTVTCRSFDYAVDSAGRWALVVTGQGVPSVDPPGHGFIEGTAPFDAHGPVWVSTTGDDPALAGALQDLAAIVTVDGPVVYDDPPCTGADPLPAGTDWADYFDFTGALDGPVCARTGWADQPSFDDPPMPASFLTLPAPPFTDVGGCQVFEPGDYQGQVIPAVATDAYFKSGDYLFDQTVRFTGAIQVVAGHPDDAGLSPSLTGAWACQDVYDADTTGPGGATFHLSGSASVRAENGASFEMMPRVQAGDDTTSVGTYHRELPVSIHALCPDPANASEWCDDDGSFPASTRDGDQTIVGTSFAGASQLIFHGLVYVPLAQVHLDSPFSDTTFEAGLVAARLWSADADPTFATAEPPTRSAHLLITATVEMSGDTTVMQANVTYDPAATDPDDRVVVTAWNLCDPAGC